MSTPDAEKLDKIEEEIAAARRQAEDHGTIPEPHDDEEQEVVADLQDPRPDN